MARISTYPLDTAVVGSDKWVGSDSQQLYATKNFTADAVADFINGYNKVESTSLRYEYLDYTASVGRKTGTISFDTTIGANVSFSTVTTFKISEHQLARDLDSLANFYTSPLIGSIVMISQCDKISNWGAFRWTGSVEDIVNLEFYDITLEYLVGPGFLEDEKDYFISILTYDATSADTTYTLPASGGASAKITLTGSDASTDIVNFTSTSNEVTLTESGGNTITASLPTDVIIQGDLTVSGATLSSFTGEVAVATATAGGNAPNLSQVQSLIAGVGVFQGGYDASTFPGTPIISGPSNIALSQGDFYVVTTAGTFYTLAVEVGDLIFANSDITASSSPAVTAYTIVQADANIAGSGATDGATVKGVSGFDSDAFDVTANGWVQQNITMAFDLGASASTTVTHSWNTTDVTAQVYEVATGATVFTKVTRAANTVTVVFGTAPASVGDYRVLITKVLTAS
jgi:hypothetical protein